MQHAAILLFFLAVLPLTAACEKQDKGPPTPQVTSGQSAPSDSRTISPAPSNAGEGEGSDKQRGEKVYKEVCATCHAQGIAGAPKIGDKAAWEPRIAKGLQTLVRNSIQGFQGNQGVMPPKGGVQSLSDQDVRDAVAYIVDKSK